MFTSLLRGKLRYNLQSVITRLVAVVPHCLYVSLCPNVIQYKQIDLLFYFSSFGLKVELIRPIYLVNDVKECFLS